MTNRVIVRSELVADVLEVEVCPNQVDGKCDHDVLDWTAGGGLIGDDADPQDGETKDDGGHRRSPLEEHYRTLPHELYQFHAATPRSQILNAIFPVPAKRTPVDLGPVQTP